MKIHVQIDDGDLDASGKRDAVATFEVFQWHDDKRTAPDAYDGFGTIRCGPYVVLIQVEHVEWQTMRYRSGMYLAEPIDEEIGKQQRPSIVAELWNRMQREVQS